MADAVRPTPSTRLGRVDPLEGVADLLQELKARSGRSYDALARRSGLSRSTVHRYSRGVIVPESFGPLEALGRACGADRVELAELYALWSCADRSRRTGLPGSPAPRVTPTGAATPVIQAEEAAPGAVEPLTVEPLTVEAVTVEAVTVGPVEAVTVESGPVEAGPEEAATVPPRVIRWPRRWRGWAIGPVLLVVVMAVAGLAKAGTWWTDDRATPSASLGGSVDPAAQRVQGPAWADNPNPVPPEFFGVTLNSDTGVMPSFRVGAVRLWDGGTRWSELEPEPGQFRWATLDRLVAGAERAGLPVLFTFGGTPDWASPDGPRTAYEDGSRASPPDDLAEWEAVVRAVSERYRSRIHAYELWVMAPAPLYYTGSAATLAAMTSRAAAVLQNTDPAATVVCPSMGELWQPQSRRFLAEFAALGGYQDCDVAGVKLHPRDFGQPPETIVELTTLIDRAFHDAGVHPRLWSTGTTYRIASATRLDEQTARDYAVRLYLVTLYAQYERMYFYNWGGHKLPIVLQAEGGPPTAAARDVARLQTWLAGAAIYACGHGADDGLPAKVWRCRFKVPGVPGGEPVDADITWTESGSATVPVDRAGVVRHLDGRVEDVRPGGSRQLTGTPTMALYGAA
jgi:hypothetical protein